MIPFIMCILKRNGKMIISTQLARVFNKAVTSTENLWEDGSVNWNYVDADVHMDMLGKAPDNYRDQFDYLADCYTGYVSPADRIVIENS